jgi:hypothetical protein
MFHPHFLLSLSLLGFIILMFEVFLQSVCDIHLKAVAKLLNLRICIFSLRWEKRFSWMFSWGNIFLHFSECRIVCMSVASCHKFLFSILPIRSWYMLLPVAKQLFFALGIDSVPFEMAFNQELSQLLDFYWCTSWSLDWILKFIWINCKVWVIMC